ncbi:MAG: histidine kinase dimerization/phospho-acceptor domain-containing protein [Thermomonas sp.]
MFDRLAHDLRGPLTPLRTAAFLLRRGDLAPDRQSELLDIIDRQTARLSRMLQEVADWQCAVEERLLFRPEASELELLIANALDGFQPDDAVRIELADEVKTAGIAGDAQRLVQMFAILLAYAQTRAVDGTVCLSGYCEASGVVVEIRCRTDENIPVNGEGRIDFTRPQAKPFDEGLGWRLMIANAIALAHGEALEVGADGDRDLLCIRVRLPVQA